MADKTIDQLTLATAINDNDLFVLQQSNTAKKLLGSALKQYIAMVEVVSIESVTFDAQNRCVITLTDGTVATSISMKGQDGTNGADAPTITNIAIDAQYHLIVTLSNGTSYDAGYCRGASGTGIGDMLISEYDSDNAVKTAGGIADYVDDEISPISESVSTLSEQVASIISDLGSGGRNCRIASGIYTGTGTGGWEHPNMLEVSFKPVLILIRTNDLNGVYQHSPTVFFYPHSRARSDAMYDQDSSKYLLVQWPADNLENPTYKVYWRTTADTPASVAPLWQNNVSGQAYFYIIIGYKDN